MKLLLFLLMLLPVVGMSQTEYKIVSELWKKGQTVMVIAKSLTSDSTIKVKVRFFGLAKKPDLIGRVGKHYPNGYGRRNVIFIISKKYQP